jgi:hypothetical protein
MRLSHCWMALLPAVASLGCASAPVPAERLASAEAGIRAATEVGAEGVPQAGLALKLARDQVAFAKSLAEKGDNERAELVFARAETDAELAVALARENAARAEANAVLVQIQTLRQHAP